MKTNNFIDTDANPVIPGWATLVSHKKSGIFEWNPENIELHLEPEQKESYIEGHKLYERLKEMPVMNVNVANFLVENPTLYPKEWKGRYVYFWGTIVQDRDGRLRVPYLVEFGADVVVRWLWLGNGWFGFDPAVRFASSSQTLGAGGLSLESVVLRLKKIEKLFAPELLSK